MAYYFCAEGRLIIIYIIIYIIIKPLSSPFSLPYARMQECKIARFLGKPKFLIFLIFKQLRKVAALPDFFKVHGFCPHDPSNPYKNTNSEACKSRKTLSIGAKIGGKTEILQEKKQKIFAHRATKCDFTSIFIAICGL